MGALQIINEAIKGGKALSKAEAMSEALAKLDAGKKLSKVENISVGLYHPIGEGKKLNVPFSRMTSTVVDNPNVIMHQGNIITPEQAVKERMGFFPLIGDRAETGKILTHVNDRKAKYQTPLTGGGKYMQANYDPNMALSSGWESAKSKVGTLRNRIGDIVESGYQPVGVFSPGSHVQVDFNTMMPHALLGQFDPADTSKRLIKQFDREVKTVYPDWLGITHPEAEAQLMDKSNGVLRTVFTKTMGKDSYQSGGFPDVPSVRKAISDPALHETELGTLGQNMALFDPTGALVESPKHPSAYPLSMSAQNLGKLDQPEKFSEFFTSANDRRRLMSSDPASDYRSFELSHPIQYADEEWLNKLMESRRLRDEAIKQGSYAEGGEVHADFHDKLDSMIQAHMADGGGDFDSRLESMIKDHHADTQLKAMIDARFANAEGMAEGGKIDLSDSDSKLKAMIDARLDQYMADGGDVHMGVGGLLNKAIKAVKGAQEVLPAVEREANKAKFLSESKDPRRMYHVTGSDFKEFKPTGSSRAVFVTPDAKFAEDFGYDNFTKSQGSDQFQTGARSMPVRVQVKRPFDYEDPEHIADLKSRIKTRPHLKEEIEGMGDFEQNWHHMEHPDIQRLIREAGYDSFYAAEWGAKNLGVYDPKRIKSDIGNRGTYDLGDPDINKANGGLAHFAAGGSSRRKADVTEALTEGLAPMLYGGAKGALASLLGFPGELEQLGRTGINFSFGSGPGHRGIDVGEEPFLPNTKRVSGALPNYRGSKVANEVAEMGTDLGENIVGTMLDPLAVIKGAKPALEALKMLRGSQGTPATRQAQRGVVKMPGGNWLTGSVEKSLEGLKGRTQPRYTHINDQGMAVGEGYGRPMTAEELQRRNADPIYARNEALNNYVDRNLTNYIKKQMATPDDPVRKLAEEGIVHIPTERVGMNRYKAPENRQMYGGEQMGKSEAAQAWEDASDVAIYPGTVGEIKRVKELGGPGADKYEPWMEKADPKTIVSRTTGNFNAQDLGFDHIMDVLREDVTSGRIRPEQLNKVSMEQAVRRTYDYDQELAAKMNASRAAAREGLPVYKEYPEGYKWIELNEPGSFASESEAMGHSVRGYEPPKGHPDWVESSGDSGSSGYGHGGWEAIKSGKAKVYSLVNPKGEPHVTVEVKHPQEISEELRWKHKDKINDKMMDYFIDNPDATYQEAMESVLAKMKNVFPASITQIKGKQNAAPKEDYLPYVQDFVKSGKWSDVGDFRNTGLIRKSDLIDKFSPDELDAIGAGEYLTKGEHDDLLLKALQPPQGMRRGGKVNIEQEYKFKKFRK